MNFVNTAKGDAYRLSSCKICEHYKSLFNSDHSPTYSEAISSI